MAILALTACTVDAGPPPEGSPRAGEAGPNPPVDDAGGGSPSADDAASLDVKALRDALAALSPAALPGPSADPTNRFADDHAAAAFGKKLFNETGFSGPLLDGDNDGSSSALGKKGEVGKVACAGCHIESAGFSDSRSYQKQISLGAGWGRRRAPSLLDGGQAKLLMWDGRKDALYNQLFGPLESVVEMNSSRLYMAEEIYILYKADYEAVFGPMPPLNDGARFPALTAERTGCQPTTVDPTPDCNGTFHGMAGDSAEFDSMTSSDQDAVTGVVVNAGKAIGAYERTLTCGTTRFDDWMHGNDTALSPAEQRGAAVFAGRGNCMPCHSGPFMSDQKFHDAGLQPAVVQSSFLDDDDHGAAVGLAQAIASPLNSLSRWSDAPGGDGRLPSAVPPGADGAFRTPTLRCVSQRPSFMHTGQFTTLESVISFFDRGGDRAGYPGQSEIVPLALSEDDKADLAAFLRALGPR
jgi:cytochrome c peroxidase